MESLLPISTGHAAAARVVTYEEESVPVMLLRNSDPPHGLCKSRASLGSMLSMGERGGGKGPVPAGKGGAQGEGSCHGQQILSR